MDRPIIYSEEVPRSFDVLWGWKDAVAALAKLYRDVAGSSSTMVAGLTASATGPASLTVNLTAGRVYQQSALDQTAYGSLASDVTTLIQQGDADAQTVTLSVGDLTSGKSKWALIQAQFSQGDAVRTGDPTSGILQFWNSANPTSPLEGQGNDGQPLPTVRLGGATINVIYGAIANTGAEVPPNPSAGFVGLYLVDLAFGQTTVVSNQILVAGPSVGANVPSNYPQAPFLAGLLNQHHKGIPGHAPKIDLTTEVQNALPYANMAPVRQKLTAALTLYVNPSTGNDGNTGLSSGAAFATAQRAADIIQQNYDLNDLTGTVVTVSCADGAVGPVIMVGPVPGQRTADSIVFSGNTATPANCTVTDAAACFTASSGARFAVQGFKLASSGGSGLAISNGSQIQITGKMDFGACGFAHIYAVVGSNVTIGANYTISGNAPAHLWTDINSDSNVFGSLTITLTGTPAFSTSFARATNHSIVYAPGLTFSGSATGLRYTAVGLSLINTGSGGASYFPGGTPGTTADNSVYS